jgi:uncharacterized protein (UPF0332 family)
MEDTLKSKPLPNMSGVGKDVYKQADLFVKKVLQKNKGMICSALFKRPSGSTLEMVFIVDDLNNVVIDQQVADIKVAASEIAYDSKLDIKSGALLASAFWDAFRAGDESTLQMVRGSLILHDNGFMLPVQDLLVTGKIRPSKESVQVYFVKAERSMKTANQKVGRSIIDLYWAVTDAAHAAVMVAGLTPPSPKDLAEVVRKELVVRNLVHKRCAEIVDRIFDAAKQIMHRERFEISGKEYDSYLADADFFIKEMDSFVKEHVEGNN